MANPTVVIEITSTGADRVRRQIEELRRAAGPAGPVQEQVAAGARSAARGTEQAAISTARAQREWQTLRSTLGGAERAAAQHERAMQRLQTAYSALGPEVVNFDRTQRLINERFTTGAVNARDLRRNLSGLRGEAQQLTQLLAGQVAASAIPGVGGFAAGQAVPRLFGATAGAGLISGIAGGFAFSRIAQAGSSFRELQAQIEATLGAGESFNSVFQDLVDISDRTGTSIEQNTRLFRRLGQAREDLNASTTDMLAFEETLSQLIISSGVDSIEAAQGTRQLAQALASGRVQGDEFRTILEAMPAVARAAARGLYEMGELTQPTIGALNQLRSEGKLAADDFFRAIISQSDEAAAAFEKIPDTIGRSSARFGTATFRLSSKLGEETGATQLSVDAINSAAEAISRFADALDELPTEVPPALRLLLGGGRGAVAENFAETVTKFAKLVSDLNKTLAEFRPEADVGPIGRPEQLREEITRLEQRIQIAPQQPGVERILQERLREVEKMLRRVEDASALPPPGAVGRRLGPAEISPEDRRKAFARLHPGPQEFMGVPTQPPPEPPLRPQMEFFEQFPLRPFSELTGPIRRPEQQELLQQLEKMERQAAIEQRVAAAPTQPEELRIQREGAVQETIREARQVGLLAPEIQQQISNTITAQYQPRIAEAQRQIQERRGEFQQEARSRGAPERPIERLLEQARDVGELSGQPTGRVLQGAVQLGPVAQQQIAQQGITPEISRGMAFALAGPMPTREGAGGPEGSRAREFKDLERSIDPVVGQIQQYQQVERELNGAVEAGVVSRARANELLEMQAARLDDVAISARGTALGLNEADVEFVKFSGRLRDLRDAGASMGDALQQGFLRLATVQTGPLDAVLETMQAIAAEALRVQTQPFFQNIGRGIGDIFTGYARKQHLIQNPQTFEEIGVGTQELIASFGGASDAATELASEGLSRATSAAAGAATEAATQATAMTTLTVAADSAATALYSLAAASTAGTAAEGGSTLMKIFGTVGSIVGVGLGGGTGQGVGTGSMGQPVPPSGSGFALNSGGQTIVGAQSGVQAIVGGQGGVDNNVMSMRVSRGERVTVEPVGSFPAGEINRPDLPKFASGGQFIAGEEGRRRESGTGWLSQSPWHPAAPPAAIAQPSGERQRESERGQASSSHRQSDFNWQPAALQASMPQTEAGRERAPTGRTRDIVAPVAVVRDRDHRVDRERAVERSAVSATDRLRDVRSTVDRSQITLGGTTERVRDRVVERGGRERASSPTGQTQLLGQPAAPSAGITRSERDRERVIEREGADRTTDRTREREVSRSVEREVGGRTSTRPGHSLVLRQPAPPPQIIAGGAREREREVTDRQIVQGRDVSRETSVERDRGREVSQTSSTTAEITQRIERDRAQREIATVTRERERENTTRETAIREAQADRVRDRERVEREREVVQQIGGATRETRIERSAAERSNTTTSEITQRIERQNAEREVAQVTRERERVQTEREATLRAVASDRVRDRERVERQAELTKFFSSTSTTRDRAVERATERDRVAGGGRSERPSSGHWQAFARRQDAAPAPVIAGTPGRDKVVDRERIATRERDQSRVTERIAGGTREMSSRERLEAVRSTVDRTQIRLGGERSTHERVREVAGAPHQVVGAAGPERITVRERGYVVPAERTREMIRERGTGAIPRQAGGPVWPGQVFQVGERGPEMLVQQAGRQSAPVVGNDTRIEKMVERIVREVRESTVETQGQAPRVQPVVIQQATPPRTTPQEPHGVPQIMRQAPVTVNTGRGQAGASTVVNVIDRREQGAQDVERREQRLPNGNMQIDLIVHPSVRRAVDQRVLDNQLNQFGVQRGGIRRG